MSIIKVYVYRRSEATYDDFPPEPAEEFVTFLQRKLLLVPTEHAGATKILLEADIEYECPKLVLDIYYERHETDAEVELRRVAESYQKEQRKRYLLTQLKDLE